MTHRERVLAVLRYQTYDRLPLLHFGFLDRTIQRWRDEGHLTADEAQAALAGDGSPGETVLASRLGFDLNYHLHYSAHNRLQPWIEGKVLEVLPDGRRKVLTGLGAIQLQSDTNESIPAEIDHLLKSRTEWEETFKPRMQFTPSRTTDGVVRWPGGAKRLADGGLDYLNDPDRELPCLLHCGSLYGYIRDMVGVVGSAYILADDERLFDEIIDTNAELCYQCAKAALETGARFDLGHFWEDICFKNGPLINPEVFARKVGPHYARFSALLRQYDLDLFSLDCDGLIDHLLPIWLDHGINVMFPIEVGTWGSSFGPWRAKYGRELRGVGGMNKTVFARDYAAVDAEVERLKPLVELGGYLPCPDHRLPQDNKWENVQYYCERMREAFGG